MWGLHFHVLALHLKPVIVHGQVLVGEDIDGRCAGEDFQDEACSIALRLPVWVMFYSLQKKATSSSERVMTKLLVATATCGMPENGYANLITLIWISVKSTKSITPDSTSNGMLIPYATATNNSSIHFEDILMNNYIKTDRRIVR